MPKNGLPIIYQRCCISSVQEIARALDGQRLPNNGQAQPDVIAGHLAVEVKCCELPQWLQDALSQAQRNALGICASGGSGGLQARCEGPPVCDDGVAFEQFARLVRQNETKWYKWRN